MDLMEIRRMLMQPHIKTIGGLPVIYDNAYYTGGNNTKESYKTDFRYFITGIFDTGSTSSKSYTYPQHNVLDVNHVYARWFNDLSSQSYDYWGLTTGQTPSQRTVNSGGRFILITVLKEQAADFFMYDNTNQRYVCKGKKVT